MQSNNTPSNQARPVQISSNTVPPDSIMTFYNSSMVRRVFYFDIYKTKKNKINSEVVFLVEREGECGLVRFGKGRVGEEVVCVCVWRLGLGGSGVFLRNVIFIARYRGAGPMSVRRGGWGIGVYIRSTPSPLPPSLP